MVVEDMFDEMENLEEEVTEQNTGADAEEEASGDINEGEEEPGQDAPDGEEDEETHPPLQETPEQTAARAAGNQAEQQAEALRRALAASQALNARYRGALASFGYKGDSDHDVLDRLVAQREKKPIDQVRSERIATERQAEEQIERHPAVLGAQQIIAEQRFASDMAAIRKEYPEEKAASVRELGPRFIQLMATGAMTAVEAYEMVKRDEIMKKRVEATKQAAAAGARGKEHLQKSGGTSKEPVVVPKEVMNSYRMFNPRATDEEIRKHFQKEHKKA
jgi:hypothetical protein